MSFDGDLRIVVKSPKSRPREDAIFIRARFCVPPHLIEYFCREDVK